MDIVVNLLQHLRALSFNEFVMIALTVVIAVSAYWQARSASRQARYARDQAEKLERAEQRLLDRERPRIRIAAVTQQVGEDSQFVGFSITNASPFAVTITSFNFELGIPVGSRGNFLKEAAFPNAVRKYRGIDLSAAALEGPRRLQYGETIRVLFREDEFEECLGGLRADVGGGHPVRIRPVCHDTLGNKHRTDSWISWSPGTLRFHGGPGPGLLAYDEWLSELTVRRTPARRGKLRSKFEELGLLFRGARRLSLGGHSCRPRNPALEAAAKSPEDRRQAH